MGFEPGDDGNIKTMGKEATLKDIRGKNKNEYIRRTNEEIYEFYQKPQRDSIIKARRLQWLGHMERVTNDRLVRSMEHKMI